jgi:hypothetical protein
MIKCNDQDDSNVRSTRTGKGECNCMHCTVCVLCFMLL